MNGFFALMVAGGRDILSRALRGVWCGRFSKELKMDGGFNVVKRVVSRERKEGKISCGGLVREMHQIQVQISAPG
jgi:hypothetical protein